MKEKKQAKSFFSGLPKLTRRNLIAMGLIFVVCCLLVSLVLFAYLPDTTERFERIIVNDNYSVPTIPLTDKIEIRQTIVAEGRLSGMRLLLSVTGTPSGTVVLTMLDQNEIPVAESRVNAADLPEDFFHIFLFETPYDAAFGEELTLSLTAENISGGTVSFLKSAPQSNETISTDTDEKDLAGFSLTENGKPQTGTLALQYITRYSGNFLYKPFITISIILFVFFELLYLALFYFKIQLHRVFLFASLILGTVYLFLIPFRTAPDEYVHIAAAYRYSNVIYGTKDTPALVHVREGDEMFLNTYDDGATNLFFYQDLTENLFSPAPKGDGSNIPARDASGIFPLLYLPQTLGVLFARLVGVGKLGLLFFGRFFNLLFYSIVVMFAIKKIPMMKPMLFAAGLLPMCLSLAASFSYDTFVIAIAFLLFSFVLSAIRKKEPLKISELVIIGVLAVLIAPGKAVYLPLIALIFFLPKEIFKNKNTGRVFRCSVVLLAILFWSAFNLTSLRLSSGITEPVAPPVSISGESKNAPSPFSSPLAVPSETADPKMSAEPANDYPVQENNEAYQKFTFNYVIRHIPQTLLLLAQTFWEQGPLWLQGLIGGRLGEIIAIKIEVNWLYVIGLLVILLLSTVSDKEDNASLNRRERTGFSLLSLMVAALFILVCITWTPINYDTIFGIQGRYFLPVLPLLLVSLRGKNLKLTKSIGNPLLFFAAVLSALSALDAFLVILKR